MSSESWTAGATNVSSASGGHGASASSSSSKKGDSTSKAESRKGGGGGPGSGGGDAKSSVKTSIRYMLIQRSPTAAPSGAADGSNTFSMQYWVKEKKQKSKSNLDCL